MKLYLVRHGESRENVTGIFEGTASPLTDLGLRQARFVSNRFASIPIDTVICSQFPRARQTADAVNEVLNKEVIESPLFGELLPPSAFIGKHDTDSEFMACFNEIYENFHAKGWHYSDEENFEDLKARAMAGLSYIQSLEAENVLLVSHGKFMRMLAAYVVLGPELSSHEFLGFYRRLITSNTGISVFERIESKYLREKDLPAEWRLVVWNDHAHLGEVK